MASVDVLLHGARVGVLAHRSELGDATEFRLADEYRTASRRAVLGQVFEESAPDRVWRTTHRIPAWFSNLLPEGRLRDILADQNGVNPERELHLLAALGEDLPGAITVVPSDAAGMADTPLRRPREAVHSDEALRFSLAGLQLKFSIDYDERGLTIPVRGQGGRWIAKLPDPRFAVVPVNEHTLLSWAGASGIEVPVHHLVETSDIAGLPADLAAGRAGQSLILQRFDRSDDGSAIHIEDFAQIKDVVGEHDKYHAANFEGIGAVIHALCGVDDFARYVRRLVFMLLSGNADMHLKNWSIIYPDGRTARLAPAYDLVATRAYEGTSRSLALNFSKTKRFEEIDRNAFLRLARKVDVEPALMSDWFDAAQTEIREQWPNFASALPNDQREALEAHMKGLRI